MDRLNYPNFYYRKYEISCKKCGGCCVFRPVAIRGKRCKDYFYGNKRMGADHISLDNERPYVRYTPTEYRDEISNLGMWITRQHIHNDFCEELFRRHARHNVLVME